jgi:peptide-methionine (S)-S-oxide reductase
MFNPRKTIMVSREKALRGRPGKIMVSDRHAVHGTPMDAEFAGKEMALFGMGCFWGAEKGFWLLPGVHSTSVGYAGGYTPNASYEEVCSGQTGHTEVVRIVFDPAVTSYEAMLKQFWEGHDPTQGMKQGADVGTQYRSAIYYDSEAQRRAAEESRDAYQRRLTAAGFGTITTEIAPATEYYFAEDYHQQYLAKNPGGYCGHGGTGVSCPIGVLSSEQR